MISDNEDIFGPDSVMSVLMLVSVFYSGWTCWGQGFRRRSVGVRTALLTFDIVLSVAVVVLATIVGDGSTQMVWVTLAVVSFVRMIYMRDSAAKARKSAEDAVRKMPPPPPEDVR